MSSKYLFGFINLHIKSLFLKNVGEVTMTASVIHMEGLALSSGQTIHFM